MRRDAFTRQHGGVERDLVQPVATEVIATTDLERLGAGDVRVVDGGEVVQLAVDVPGEEIVLVVVGDDEVPEPVRRQRRVVRVAQIGPLVDRIVRVVEEDEVPVVPGVPLAEDPRVLVDALVEPEPELRSRSRRPGAPPRRRARGRDRPRRRSGPRCPTRRTRPARST